jgi:glycosidase
VGGLFYVKMPNSPLPPPKKKYFGGTPIFAFLYPLKWIHPKGIESRLPYFAELGIDAVWLSPIYKSPMKDFGYDISDFRVTMSLNFFSSPIS